MKSISSLAFFAVLIGATGCAGAVEHGNVAFDVSPDGKAIVFSAADGNLYLFNLETQHVDRLTTGDDAKSQPDFYPDGRSIVFSTSNSGARWNLAVLDLDDKKVRVLAIVDGTSDSSPAFSRDGRQLTFVRAHRSRPYSFGGMIWDDYDIYVINKDGSDCRRLTQMKYYGASSPQFTADGKNVIYTGTTNNYPSPSFPVLLEVGTDGSKPPVKLGPKPNVKGIGPTGTLGIGAWASDPCVSPDGTAIALISDRAKNWTYDLYVMKRDGSEVKPLGITGISKYNKSPVFLADGKGILFLAGTEENGFGRPIFSLWRIDVDGKNARRIADSGLFTDPQHWKPKP